MSKERKERDAALHDMFERSIMHTGKEQYAEAMNLLNEVLTEKPDFKIGWNNRGILMTKLGHPFDAIMCYDRAIALDPKIVEFHNNRGVANFDSNRFDKALEDYERAIALKPNFEQGLVNKGNVLMRLGKPHEAIEIYRRVLKINENEVEANLGLAFGLLETGQFLEGWKQYEWRWKSNQMVARGLDIPEWKGRPASHPDDILLLYSEQGLGDTLQFLRFAPLAKQRWKGKVYIEVRHALARIARTLKDIDGVIIIGEKRPDGITDCYPLLSMPYMLGTTLETLPSECPYLHADPYRTSIWRERIKVLPTGMRVGLCWAGMNRPMQPVASSIDARRSTSLASCAPLAAIPGIAWVSLQKGLPWEQIKTPPPGMFILDWTDDFDDMYDTAAMIECLDLVITVDTAVLHMAASLGKPTWVLHRHDPCWRWLGHRKDSPWYPTVRNFYQKKPGDWDTLMKEVADELRTLVQHSSQLAA